MIAAYEQGKMFSSCRTRTLLAASGLAACLCLSHAGCSLLPAAVRNIPARVGLRSKQAELRDRVQDDKFPTAKEAGLQ